MVLLIPLTVAAYFAFKIVPGGWRAEVASWPIWVRGLAAFVVGDLGFYWEIGRASCRERVCMLV